MSVAVAESADRSRYHGYRFPREIIAHAVWLYFRFHLSFREFRTCSRSEASSSATKRFGSSVPSSGPGYAADEYAAGDKWHLDEVRGVVLDILVQERRDQAAAERFLHPVLDGEGGAEPRVVITDKLAGYPPAIKRVLPTAERRASQDSHLPTRKRERVLQRFKSAEHAHASWARSAPSPTTSDRVDTD